MTFNLCFIEETYFHRIVSNFAGPVCSQGNTRSVFLNLIQFSKQKQQPTQLFLKNLEYTELLYLQVGFVRDVDPVTTGSSSLSEFFLPLSCNCISSKALPFVSGTRTAVKIVPAMHITANSQKVTGNPKTSSKF